MGNTIPQIRTHLDFGSQLCTLTLNNAVTTERSTEIPPNSLIQVLCSSMTPHMNKGPVLITSNLRNKFQHKLFVPDIYTEIDTLNKPVFKIPITNKTEKYIFFFCIYFYFSSSFYKQKIVHYKCAIHKYNYIHCIHIHVYVPYNLLCYLILPNTLKSF